MNIIDKIKSIAKKKNQREQKKVFHCGVSFGVMGNTTKKEVHPCLHLSTRLPRRPNKCKAKMHRVCTIHGTKTHCRKGFVLLW